MIEENQIVYAKFSQRFSAGVVDGFIIFMGQALLTPLYKTHIGLAIGFFVTALVPVIYRIVLHKKYGQTLGKMTQKIKLVTLDTEPVHWKHVIVRPSIIAVLHLIVAVDSVLGLSQIPSVNELDYFTALSHIGEARSLNFIISLLPIVYIFGDILFIFTNEKRRSISDYIAKTMVIVLPQKNSVK